MLKAERKNILLLIGIKLALTLPFINSFPIDLDEPFSIFHAQKSLPELFELFRNENNPPLHFLLLHGWEKLFGTDLFAVRSLSLVFSILTIPALFLLARIYLTRIPAYAILLLFLFSDFHHYHSMEARTYSLLVLLFTLTALVISRILLENKKERKYFVLLGVLNILLFYTHYISLFVFASELSLVLLFLKELHLKYLVITCMIALAGILPWMGILFDRTSTITSGGTWVPEAAVSELYGFINKFLNNRSTSAVLILSAGLTIYLSRKTIRKFISVNHSRIIILLVLFAVPFSLAFILSVTSDFRFFLDRYLFFLTIPLFLLIVGLFDDHSFHSKFLFLPFLITYLISFNLKPDNNRDGDQLARTVRTLKPDKILIAPGYYQLTFLYHYDRVLFENYRAVEMKRTNSIFVVETGMGIESTLLTGGTIILINAGLDFTEPNNTLEQDIALRKEKISIKKFKGGYTVSEWQ